MQKMQNTDNYHSKYKQHAKWRVASLMFIVCLFLSHTEQDDKPVIS